MKLKTNIKAGDLVCGYRGCDPDPNHTLKLRGARAQAQRKEG